jgi:hypothetical protein
MPLRSQRLHNRVRDGFATALALGTIPMCMAIYTPSIPILFHKRSRGIKWITALSAEEMSGMPFCTASNDDFTFNGCLAALAARGEELVEVEVAVEAWGFVGTVIVLEARHVVCCGVRGEVGYVSAGETGADAVHTFGMFVGGFWVKGYAFEMLAALVAGEAFRVEARTGC